MKKKKKIGKKSRAVKLCTSRFKISSFSYSSILFLSPLSAIPRVPTPPPTPYPGDMEPPGSLRTTVSPPNLLPKVAAFPTSLYGVFCLTARLKPPRRCRLRLRVSCSSEISDARTSSSRFSSRNGDVVSDSPSENQFLNFEVRSPPVPASIISAPKLSLGDQAFLLLAFIGCTVC